MILNYFLSYGNVMYILCTFYAYILCSKVSILTLKTCHVPFLHITNYELPECTTTLANKSKLNFFVNVVKYNVTYLLQLIDVSPLNCLLVSLFH